MYCGILFSLNARSPSKRSFVGITCENKCQKFQPQGPTRFCPYERPSFLNFVPFFSFMCQNVERRLVVRSNDDRRHSTTIFSESVAVTEISKQIIEVSSFCDWEIW